MNAATEQLGVVKWFGNNRTNGQYGFLTDATGSDLFFHRGGIASEQYHPDKDDVVVFVPFPSLTHPGRFEAESIRPLGAVSDLDFLLATYIAHAAKPEGAAIAGGVARRIGAIVKDADERLAIVRRVGAALPPQKEKENSADPTDHQAIVSFTTAAFPEHGLNILSGVLHDEPVAVRYRFWRQNLLDWQEEFLQCFCEDWSDLPPEESESSERTNVPFVAPPDPRWRWSKHHRTTVELMHKGIPSDSLPSLCKALSSHICLLPLDEGLSRLDILFKEVEGNAELSAKVQAGIELSGGSTLKVVFWLRDKAALPPLEDLKSAIGNLPSNKQQDCFKRLLLPAPEEKHLISPNEVCHLEWSDLTIRVVCAAIHAREEKSSFGEREVYAAIVSCLDNQEEALELCGLFDRCEGRAYCKSDSEDGAGASVEAHVEIRRADVPKFVTYCEGRLAIDRRSGQPVLDRKFNRRFWFCGNQMCFQNSISRELPASWQGITMLHAMTLCGVPPSEHEYEVLLGTLNRINRILKHMKCRKCGNILHPKGQSVYAFYRVARFACRNEACDCKSEIYLNHCLNGACRNVVDSRDSTKCCPEGHDQHKCGWYICDYCLACCSSKGLERRRQQLETLNYEWTCHTEGHRDRGDICCVQCGGLLKESGDEQAVTRNMEWLLKHKDDKSKIVKWGTRQDGGRWFLVRKSAAKSQTEFRAWVKRLDSLGFDVPRDVESRDVQLVGESISGLLLKCRSCDYELNVSSLEQEHDYERLSALRYHTLIAGRFPRPQR